MLHLIYAIDFIILCEFVCIRESTWFECRVGVNDIRYMWVKWGEKKDKTTNILYIYIRKC